MQGFDLKVQGGVQDLVYKIGMGSVPRWQLRLPLVLQVLGGSG
jgi:hypothetical protein